MVCRSPRMLAICAWASSSRGRDRTTSGGRAGSQLWMVACSPRRLNTESKCSSTSRAAHSGSPAARAWRTASSGSPRWEYHAAALRCRRRAALRIQPGPQQIGEQMVIPPPAADVVELDHEQAGPVRFFEQVLAVVAARDGVAQGPAEALEHRRLEEEAAELGTLLFEDLLGQVVKDVPVAAGERGHEAGDVRLAAQRQGRQLQARRPALGPFGQGGRRGTSTSAETWRSSSAASPAVNLRSSARTSPSSPRARYRARPSGGSDRPASTIRSWGGRCSSRNRTDACTVSELTR